MPSTSVPKFNVRSSEDVSKLIGLLALGAITGTVFWAINLPLPYMLGGLLSAVTVFALSGQFEFRITFPKHLRMVFVGLIGAMIGSTFTPELRQLIPTMLVTVLSIVLYVVLAHALSYMVCRKLGRYDKVTAFYSSMPGGLIEAVELAERGGGDTRVVTLCHFIRVFIVVITVPLFYWVVSGDLVGSAAGETFERGQATAVDVIALVLITAAGLGLGRFLHIPAAHLLGPLILSAVLNGTGLLATTSPTWLLFIAQLIVGTGLGAQFRSPSTAVLLTAFKTTVAITILMLLMSTLSAYLLTKITNQSMDGLFLLFAPGGVTEMSLIALSLNLSPVVVAAHHVLRIFLTVSIAAASTRYFKST